MMRASLSTSSVLPSIVVERMNHLSLVMLNRPQKLNALDSEMVSLLTKALRDDLLSKEGCFAFLMFGGGNKAFCAGGDVASVRASGLENPASGEWNSFFREEYRLDALLGSLGSPSSRVKQISFWEGIVMGGGVGLSAHGRFRVTTETTKLAMPETSIGLFPDVGATRLLSRMPRATGIYAALTGARLDAADLMYSGLATHYVPTEKVDAAFAAVAKIDLSRMAPEEADARVDSALKRHSTSVPTKPSSLEINGDVIERCFSHESVEAIAEALRSGTTQFEIDTAKALDAVSPTSLKITLECLKRAKSSSLDEVLKTDFRVACRCCDPAKKSDFYEGVRAVLVDKDRNPSWNPASLQEVSDEDIQRYFDPLDTPLSELDLDDI